MRSPSPCCLALFSSPAVARRRAHCVRPGESRFRVGRRARLRRLKFLHHRRKFADPTAAPQCDSPPSPQQVAPDHFDHVVYSPSGGLFRSPRPRAQGELKSHAGPASDKNSHGMAVLHVKRKVFDELAVHALRRQKKRLQEQLEQVSRVHGQDNVGRSSKGEDRLEGNDLSKVLCREAVC